MSEITRQQIAEAARLARGFRPETQETVPSETVNYITPPGDVTEQISSSIPVDKIPEVLTETTQKSAKVHSEQDFPVFERKKDKMSDPCVHTTGLPFVYDSPGEARDTIREVSSGARLNLKETADASRFNLRETADGVQKLMKDHADSDRFTGSEFTRNQKDHTDQVRWEGDRFCQLQHEILRAEGRLTDSDRRTELAVEKTSAGTQVAIEKSAAATNLAIEKTAAATNLAIQTAKAEILLEAAKNAAAAALCCCELQGKMDANTASILAAMKDSEAANLRQQLTVFQIRAGVLASPA